MRMLHAITTAARRMSGAGAVRNARLEVDRASWTAADLERQLDRVTWPAPAPAAAAPPDRAA